MKLKKTLLSTALLTTMFFPLFAAQELTPEKADALVPFETITFSGQFNAISDANRAASKRADKRGASAFYVRDIFEQNRGTSKVYVDLYHADAPAASTETQYREYQGIRELPRKEASQFEPFDVVSLRGYYPTQIDVNNAIARQAKEKGAFSFFIVRQNDMNDGANQEITAFIYKKDAPKRQLQIQDNPIPADSDAGRAALAEGGAAAAEVEIPNVASSSSLSDAVGRFFETQSSKTGSRYSVTLRDGTRIEELNNATAMKMMPFDSIRFTHNFSSSRDMSERIAKRVAAKGGKYYHITSQHQQGNSGNITVTVDIFK